VGDALLALVERRAPGATDVEVEVQPVLGRFAFWNPLDEDARRDAVGIDDGPGVVPVLLGDLHRSGPVVPRFEPLRGRRDDIAERQHPELGEGRRVAAVEHDLDAGGPLAGYGGSMSTTDQSETGTRTSTQRLASPTFGEVTR
jgi:hypothetical protein